MRKLFFPALMVLAFFFSGRLHAQLYTPQPDNTETYKTQQANGDSIGHIVLKPTILQSGGTIFVEKYRQQPFILNFFNAGGAKVASYIVRDNSLYVNTSGWGKGLYFYNAVDAFHPFLDAGKILVL
jgi:hypothetical protein